MKVAVVGSRGLQVSNLQEYLPENANEIVSGGAKGIDLCAKKYAIEHAVQYTEFLPNYKIYKRGAPLKRNIEIIEYADFVLIFWNGTSKGTLFVINACKKQNIPHQVIVLNELY